MEAEKTKNFIKAAIASETENAKEKWGDKYHSEHEAWAVLSEEVEEANEAFLKIGNITRILWHYVRKANKTEDDQRHHAENLRYLKDHAQELAIEAVQIAAVAQKFLDTLEDA